jgi:hypothetical protein
LETAQSHGALPLLVEQHLFVDHVLVKAQARFRRSVSVTVDVDHMSLGLSVTHVGLSIAEAGIGISIGLLCFELAEVSHHISDGLFVHGDSLLKYVKGSRNNIELTDHLLESLSKLFTTSSDSIIWLLT